MGGFWQARVSTILLCWCQRQPGMGRYCRQGGTVPVPNWSVPVSILVSRLRSVAHYLFTWVRDWDWKPEWITWWCILLISGRYTCSTSMLLHSARYRYRYYLYKYLFSVRVLPVPKLTVPAHPQPTLSYTTDWLLSFTVWKGNHVHKKSMNTYDSTVSSVWGICSIVLCSCMSCI